MPDLTNTLVDAAGRPRTGSLITIQLIGVWSADGLHETQPAAVWSGVTDSAGVWTATLPAQSAYEGSTYYLVREPSVSHTCTVADSPSTQRLRDRLMTPVPTATATGVALEDLTDVTTSGALAGKVLGYDGTIWKPTTASGGGGGSVNSVTNADATITIGGTASDPTVAVNAIPESKVTSLVTDLAAKVPTTRTVTAGTGLSGGGDLSANRTLAVSYGSSAGTSAQGNDSRLSDARTPTAHSHPESDVTGLTADLAAKADLVGGKVPTAELGSGTANGTKFLRGDQTWAAPAGGGTVTSVTAGDSTITIGGTASDPTVAVNAIPESKVTNLVSDLAAKAMSLTATAVKTSNYPAGAGELVRGDTSGGVFTVTLPASSVGTLIGIKKTDSSANALNFAVTGGDTIDGVSSGSLTLSNQSRIFLGVTGGWTVPYGLNSLASLDARYVPKSLVDAKGDLLTATADDTPARLAVGSNNQLLLPDSAQAAGLKWADGPPALVATGLTGATQGRFVGVTTVGAPTSGTFAVGDFVVTQSGEVLVCTVAGTPGTWVSPSDLKNLLAVGEETVNGDIAVAVTVGTGTGTLRLSYFTARKTETTTQVRVYTGTTAAAATPTICRIGLYSIAANGNGTLVASTANDTTLFAAASTAYTRSWSASFAKVAGQLYALGIIVVSGAATPTLAGILAGSGISAELFNFSPRRQAALGSQTDLPGSFTNASLVVSTSIRHYGVVLP